MAAKYNYRGIELWHEDLMDVADRYTGGSALVSNQLTAAHHVRRLCEARNLHILCLQPFQHFEGLLDRAQHARRLDELRIWFQLAHALQTDLIQIPSNVLPQEQVSADLADHIADLREGADMGAAETPPLRFSFESLGWGARCDTWKASWEVVLGVDRPNFWALPRHVQHLRAHLRRPDVAEGALPQADEALRASMERLVATVDVARIFYVQVVDDRAAAGAAAGGPRVLPRRAAGAHELVAQLPAVLRRAGARRVPPRAGGRVGHLPGSRVRGVGEPRAVQPAHVAGGRRGAGGAGEEGGGVVCQARAGHEDEGGGAGAAGDGISVGKQQHASTGIKRGLRVALLFSM
ncbi:3-dehydroshikimate dehydratase [Verticillium alfalfae VaMs.102]|uniref:3-dehydroshikimate dehydratase n=1 Tax=Verticillium alfalfae (strain VaMs.102 / ATCC MYA-4576 / FGSC 10136) TaxID=526221 RepID=C9SU88_VERA1|nr:3-dehydroshikimate dehydratase [Verticillium alfalfae VaMs.102]EEY22399.1 3-dehydroshikimate dehydratase [Verticillium alfalfae VaMs.102]